MPVGEIRPVFFGLDRFRTLHQREKIFDYMEDFLC